MAKTNATIRMGITDSQANSSPVLSAVRDSAKLLYSDAVLNVGVASNLQQANVAHANCLFLGNNPPASSAGQQLCLGLGNCVAHVGGALAYNIQVRYYDNAGAPQLGYIKIYNAP